MAMTTRCPQCGTAFKVVPDQLRVRDGLVRCGECATVFDGRACLVARIPDGFAHSPAARGAPSMTGTAASKTVAPTPNDSPEPPQTLSSAPPELPRIPTSAPPEPPRTPTSTPPEPPQLPTSASPAVVRGRSDIARRDPYVGERLADDDDREADERAPFIPARVDAPDAPPPWDHPGEPDLPGDSPAWEEADRRDLPSDSSAWDEQVRRDLPAESPAWSEADRRDLSSDSSAWSEQDRRDLPDDSPVWDEQVRRDLPSDSSAWSEQDRRGLPDGSPAWDEQDRRDLPDGSSAWDERGEPGSAGDADDEHDRPVILGESRTRYHGATDSGRAPPEFLDADQQARRSVLRSLWGYGCLVGLLLIAVQLIYVYRSSIADMSPQLRPLLVRLCEPLGCQVDYARHIDRISITSSSLQPPAGQVGAPRQDNVTNLVLRASLRNLYTEPQPWPALRLDLSDLSDTVVIRKILLPEDYLPPGQAARAFAPGAELNIAVPIAVSGPHVNGFQIHKFFP